VTSRAARLRRRRRGSHRRLLITIVVVALVAAAAGVAYAFAPRPDATSASASAGPAPSASHASKHTTTTERPTTTTTTIPPITQPKAATLPSPGSGLGYGSQGPVVAAYQQRMKDLHFDPGPVDGDFSQNTQYAVIAVQKYFGQQRTGRIDAAVQFALEHFHYSPALPKSEPNRVEVDLDRQVITVFTNWQPILVTTTSTGSGEYFCGGADGCQYAITPTGHFHFYELDRGWKEGKLGKMWNPYFFNGGIAIHGLQSVPAYPASHGCARIPMDIANYFYTLVNHGESVYVVGTPMKAGNGYVGPIRTPSTQAPSTTPTTKANSPTTKKSSPTTKPSPPTTKPSPPTTKKSPPTTKP
jgi:peptidoglycan hydrolase-like protein with peptidoglycan-binding domain